MSGSFRALVLLLLLLAATAGITTFAVRALTVPTASNADLNDDNYVSSSDLAQVACLFGPVPATPDTCSDRDADLVIESLAIELETGGSCAYASTSLGVRLGFANAGSQPAMAFDVTVNSSTQRVGGLLPGYSGTLWFLGYPMFTAVNAMVDAGDEVMELDETNNTVSTVLPIPTLPATCTPTPSPTATPIP